VPLYIFVCFYFSCWVVLAVVYCCDLTGFGFFSDHERLKIGIGRLDSTAVVRSEPRRQMYYYK